MLTQCIFLIQSISRSRSYFGHRYISDPESKNIVVRTTDGKTVRRLNKRNCSYLRFKIRFKTIVNINALTVTQFMRFR